MRNLSNFPPTSGITPPVSYPPGDPRASELASILRSLELGRQLYQFRRRNAGFVQSAERTVTTPYLPTAKPVVRAPFRLPERLPLGIPSPLPVQPQVRIPFPLPARPGYPPGVLPSPLPTPSIPQRNLSCTTTHLLQLTTSAASEIQHITRGDVAPISSSRVTPSLPPSLPNLLPSRTAPAKGCDTDAVLAPRSDQGVQKKKRRKKKKTKSQKNGNDSPVDQNRGQAKSQHQKKGSKENQAGDSSKGKSGGRA